MIGSIFAQITVRELSQVINNDIMLMILVEVSNSFLNSYWIIDNFDWFEENKELSNC